MNIGAIGQVSQSLSILYNDSISRKEQVARSLRCEVENVARDLASKDGWAYSRAGLK